MENSHDTVIQDPGVGYYLTKVDDTLESNKLTSLSTAEDLVCHSYDEQSTTEEEQLLCLPLESLSNNTSDFLEFGFREFGYLYECPAFSKFTTPSHNSLHYVRFVATNEVYVAKIFELSCLVTKELRKKACHRAKIAQFLSLSALGRRSGTIDTYKVSDCTAPECKLHLYSEKVSGNKIDYGNRGSSLRGISGDRDISLKSIGAGTESSDSLGSGRGYSNECLDPPTSDGRNEFSAILEKPNIVLQFDWFMIDEHNLVTVFENCKGDSLFSKISEARRGGQGHFEEPYVLHVFREICLGVAYLHNRKIVHGDIKASNVLFRDELCHYPKIGDFETSHETGEVDLCQVGTMMYMAPEIVLDRRCGTDYKSDIWTLGCLLFEMLTFSHPFSISYDLCDLLSHFSNFSVYKKMLLNRIPQFYSKNMRSLVDLTLQFSPKKRPCIRELLYLLEDCQKVQKVPGYC